MAALGVAVLCGSVARANPPEVQKNGIAYAKGHTPGHGKPGGALLLYHNGGVMNTGAAVQAIFWGPKWSQSSFAGDKIAGLGVFYGGIGGTAYLGTNTEYTDSLGRQVQTNVSVGNSLPDTSATPARDPGTSGIQAEVAKMITNPVSNGYYPVYTDIRRGSAGYCAWHSWGTVKGVSVQFAFFFDLDGDGGCDPDQYAGHSQGLAALANVSGHELSEALTDPRGAGWYDRQGAENADKCAWSFNGPEGFTNKSTWYIQGNFSNRAYTNRTGYDGGGCINGNP
jgi:hypothetical protein